MPLNKVKKGSNMYPWITDTWNPLGGVCPHKCIYCSTKKFYYPVLIKKYSGPIRLIDSELKTNLGSGNFIFVCAQHDLFADDIPSVYIDRILTHCANHPNNKYLFQTKNPFRISDFTIDFDHAICTTIETNRWYPEYMGNTQKPEDRAFYMDDLWHKNKHGKIKNYVTIEPIMDFDLKEMLHLIDICSPEQVNIGADSGNNNLPEPDKAKILQLISVLEKFTIVKQKSNLKRLLT